MHFIKKHCDQNNKKIFRLLFKLAFPIAVQNFLTSAMAFIDMLMIGQLNETAVAAVGIANQFVFIFIIVQFGIHSGISIFTAQYWGKKEYVKIKKLLGIGILNGLFFCLIFSFAAMVIPEFIISLFSKDPQVVHLGAGYLKIVGTSFIITTLTLAYMSNLRSIGIVSIPMYASAVSVALNVILNWILIFGKWGMPEMGVNGAALATCISKFLEGFILISTVYFKKYPVAAKISQMLDFDLEFFKKIFHTCWPVFLNEFLWVTGVSVYNLVYARISTESIAAINIVASIESFVLIPFFGLFYAGAIILGNTIGAGKSKLAYQYGKHLLKLQFSMAVIAGSLMILSRGTILSFYNISDAAYTNAYHLMCVVGIVLCVKITNFTNIVSVLRGGGDTRFGFLLDLTGVWIIGVPMAFFGAFYLNLPVYWVMALVVTEEVYKLGFGIRRFRSRKWIKNLAAN